MLARVTLDTETGRDRYFAARERELAASSTPASGMLAERYAKIRRLPGLRELRLADALHRRAASRSSAATRCDLVFSNPQVREELVEEEYRTGWLQRSLG